MGGGTLDATDDWFTTVLSWLGFPFAWWLSECQVRLRQDSSDSRRDHCSGAMLGEGEGAYAAALADVSTYGRPTGTPAGAWKGFAPDGTLSLRPGVRVPVV